MKARVFRDRLEFLKHAVEEGDRDETREYIGLVNRAYGRIAAWHTFNSKDRARRLDSAGSLALLKAKPVRAGSLDSLAAPFG